MRQQRVLLVHMPVPRQQLIEAIGGMLGDPCQHVGERRQEALDRSVNGGADIAAGARSASSDSAAPLDRSSLRQMFTGMTRRRLPQLGSLIDTPLVHVGDNAAALCRSSFLCKGLRVKQMLVQPAGE